MKYIYKVVLYIKNGGNIVYTKYKCEKSKKMTCFIWKLYEGLVARLCDHWSDESCRKVFIPDQKKRLSRRWRNALPLLSQNETAMNCYFQCKIFIAFSLSLKWFTAGKNAYFPFNIALWYHIRYRKPSLLTYKIMTSLPFHRFKITIPEDTFWSMSLQIKLFIDLSNVWIDSLLITLFYCKKNF